LSVAVAAVPIVSDEELVADAVHARREAESLEGRASPSRWREADRYHELKQRGWTVRRIAQACGTNVKTVSVFSNAALRYRNEDERPRFWDAYAEVTGEKKANLAVVPEPPASPAGTYATIVADPPWRYDNKATRGAAEDHYQTMTVAELCDPGWVARNVAAAENAHLYLWTTHAFLRESFDVVEAWGFTYRTHLVWVKPQIGMGNYFRSAHEHVLFGTRGKLPILDRTIPSWFEAPRGRHSAKPGSFRDLVKKASPGPYLELFSRDRPLDPDWHVWGNEV
jgi:N6-adenosine-specific RNA methylase IME4